MLENKELTELPDESWLKHTKDQMTKAANSGAHYIAPLYDVWQFEKLLKFAIERSNAPVSGQGEAVEGLEEEAIKKVLYQAWMTDNPKTFGEAMDHAAKAICSYSQSIQPQAAQMAEDNITTVVDGWYIPFDCMSGPANKTFREMNAIIKRGGQVDVVARCNGKDYRWECDGLKYAKTAPSPYKYMALTPPQSDQGREKELNAARGPEKIDTPYSVAKALALYFKDLKNPNIWKGDSGLKANIEKAIDLLIAQSRAPTPASPDRARAWEIVDYIEKHTEQLSSIHPDMFDIIRKNLSTPSEPSITIRELKALAEGMKKIELSGTTNGEDDMIYGHNAALAQIIEAAEKGAL